MQKTEIATMYDVEDRHWWYAGLRDIVFSSIGELRNAGDGLLLLDAGCGTGGILSRCDGVRAYGFDVSAEATAFCQSRDFDRVLQATVSKIPFRDDCFDVVLSLDVLTCIEKQECGTAFAEIGRVLRPGGTLVLNLPAYQWLMSRHDRAVGTRRRITAGGLRLELEAAGFTVEKMTYRNMFLFPAIAVKRLLDRKSRQNAGPERSDLRRVPEAINGLLRSILILENRLLSRLDFPFGLSVFCIARKGSVSDKQG